MEFERWEKETTSVQEAGAVKVQWLATVRMGVVVLALSRWALGEVDGGSMAGDEKETDKLGDTGTAVVDG